MEEDDRRSEAIEPAAAEPGAAGPDDFDMVAASIRADAADIDTFFAVLVAKMADALGDRVSLQRAGGLFRRERPITGVELDLTNGGEGLVLAATRQHETISCTVVRRVRGIALSTKQLPTAQWIEQLVSALAQEAERSEQTWRALHGLLS